MEQKSQKSEQDQTSVCLDPGVGVEAENGQLLSATGGCQNLDSMLADQSLLEQPSDLSEQLTPNSEVPVVTEEEKEEQNKELDSKRWEGRSHGKCVPVVPDYEAEGNIAVDTNLKEEEILVEESCSESAAQSMGKSTLQKEFVFCLRQKRSSSLPCESDIAPKKNCAWPLQEPELNISSSLEKETKEERKHKMVTRAFLKSKRCENDSEKLDGKSENPVAMAISWFMQGILENQMAIGQVVDSATTESLVISRVTGYSEKKTQGKHELVTSSELRIKMKTSREQKTDISNIQYENLAETYLNSSPDGSITKLLEQSACLQKTEETEHKDPVSCWLEGEAALHCGGTAFPVTKSRCLQLLDVKTAEKQVEKDSLVVYQDDKLRCLTKLNDFACGVTKNPVVRLIDCRYIKALLNPTGDLTVQSYKHHFEFLQVTLGQSSGMGQNDLNCSSNIVQAGSSLFQTSMLVGRVMCQNKIMPPQDQNGKKRFRENFLELKKNSKRIKMAEVLQKPAVQKVLLNRGLYSEYKLQIDKNVTADSSVIAEELNYNETVSLLSLAVPDFLLKKHDQEHPNQLVTLPGNKQVSHFTQYNAGSFEKSGVKEENIVSGSKTMDPHTSFSSPVKDDSVVEMLVDEKFANCSSNIVGYMQGKKRAPKGKTLSKTGKKLQFSCQRVVPFSGKRNWPHESCARTLWFCKDYMSGSTFFRGTDSSANLGQVKLHQLLVDTSKVPANKLVDCKIELSVESPAAETHLDIHTAVSGTADKNGISSTGMERPKQFPSRVTKNAKKYKITLNSPLKNIKKEESMVKTNVSIDTQNGISVDSSKNKAKSLVSEQTAGLQVPKVLSMGNLSNFKIPLLKDRSILGKNILDYSAASVEKDRSKMVSSDFEHLFHSAVEEHTDHFDSSVAGALPRESGVGNKDLATSLESDLEWSALKNTSNSLSIGCTKKPTQTSVTSEKYEDMCSSTLAQNEDKLCTDILKAYDDDALVLDVIQDDPDLFGNTYELEVTSSKEHVTDNFCSTSISSEENLVLKSESSPFPRRNFSQLSPKESPIQVHGTQRSTSDVSASLAEVDEAKPDSLRRTTLKRGATKLSCKDELLTEWEDLNRSSVSDVKDKFSVETAAVNEGIDIQEPEKIENTEHQHASLDQKLLLPPMEEVASQQQGAAAKTQQKDFRISQKVSLMPSTHSNSCGSSKEEKNEVGEPSAKRIRIERTTFFGFSLPRGYCRLHFNTLNGCVRFRCRFAHVPAAGDSKLCNEILQKYISIGEKVLLKRAVQIFTAYYKEITHEVKLDPKIVQDLVISLFQCCLLKELFHVLQTCLMIEALSVADVFIKVFEHVASVKSKEVVPQLINISSQLVEDGMVLEYEHFSNITKFLDQLRVSSQDANIYITRLQIGRILKTSVCDFDSALAVFQRCKDQREWTKLGIVFIHVRRECKNADDLEKCSLFIANILTLAVKEESEGVPFCEFTAAVNAMPWHNKSDKRLLGRIGISVLYSYYKIREWLKARKVLDTLHALQIHFTCLKGLIGSERFEPQWKTVNLAVEVFLNSGSLHGAVWVLKESRWAINTSTLHCDKMDVLKRHNLLCKISSEYVGKKCYAEALEVLQNLPGLQNTCDSLDASQYNHLFNNLLRASSENKSLGVSSAVIDFMLEKNIPLDFELLRAFITALGRNCLWRKARAYYKNALALGCYPLQEGNLYRKSLLLPSYVTEVEMALAIEIFLVSNASVIQNPGASDQILQIILKRCRGNGVQNKDDYQSAMERLIQATQLATPKLSLKHLTVNVNQEHVYIFEPARVVKWLKENMRWVGKVWLFH